MIRPFESAQDSRTLPSAVCYQIIAWGDTLPAFDPLMMVKTALLSPNSVKKVNRLVLKFSWSLEKCTVLAIILRFATFFVPAFVGRILAPIAAILHIPPIVIFAAGMRIDYMKIILRSFDFGFLFAANTIWATVFGVVLGDWRSFLVAVCWVNFTNSLLQETHLRNNRFIVLVTIWEWLFFVMLMIGLSLDLVDEVNHYAFTTAHGGKLSTKDLLTNVIGTMAMLSLRNVYQRYKHLKHQRNNSGMAMQTLGYRTKIALCPVGPLKPLVCSSATLQQVYQTAQDNPNKRHLLQMQLAADSKHFDPTKTVWPKIGALTPISAWKLIVLYGCGVIGGIFAVLSLFLPRNIYRSEVIAVFALAVSSFFTGFCTCCCQRQLLRRVMTSFHFLFLASQILAAGICLVDIFSWRWVSSCGIISGILMAYCILTVDGLTPIMKQRLRFKYWIVVNGSVLFLLVMLFLLLDVLVLDNWGLQDRVFLKFECFGRKSQFRVAPFLLSRVFTILIWSGRYVYVVLTRQDDKALILLRGNVEFDYEAWKKQTIQH